MEEMRVRGERSLRSRNYFVTEDSEKQPRSFTMSGKIIPAMAAIILLRSTALASAQTREFPQDRYWGDYGYYGQGVVYPPVAFGFGVAS
jgi:hypothetical protein